MTKFTTEIILKTFFFYLYNRGYKIVNSENFEVHHVNVFALIKEFCKDK